MTRAARRARWSSWLVEVVLILAIGYVVFCLIRAYVAERYKIPSPSMEPTLHGDQVFGDVVLVDKTAWWWQDPVPFDMVVVRSAQPGRHHIVKRLAAIGPADVRMARGDLFVDHKRGAGLQRLEKDPVAHRDLRIDVFRHQHGPCVQTLEEFFHLPPTGSRVVDGGVVELQPAAADLATLRAELAPARRHPESAGMAPFVPGLIGTFKGIDTSFLDPAGRRQWQGQSYYADIGIELDLTPAAGTRALVFVHEYRDHDLALLWSADGSLALVREGELLHSVAATGFAAGVQTRVEFGYLDGHLFLSQDGALVFHHCVEMPVVNRVAKRFNGLQFGVCGSAADGAVRLHRLRVFRDIAASSVAGVLGPGNGGIYRVDAGRMFLLGDNPHDSSDSRTTLDTVSLDLLIGRPFAIVAPRERAKIFSR